LLILKVLPFEGFFAHVDLTDLVSVHELVISLGIQFLGWFLEYELIISSGIPFSVGFLVPKLEIPGGIPIVPLDFSSMSW
jgi:hypothetical protein